MMLTLNVMMFIIGTGLFGVSTIGIGMMRMGGMLRTIVIRKTPRNEPLREPRIY